MKNLSVIVHTYNEEKNIRDCIRSIKQIAGEIIVADMQSEDRTVILARELGAKVISVRKYGYADPARNFAISKATGDWVLILDADERINKSLCDKFKKIILEDKYEVIQIPRKNIIFGKWIKHTFWWPDYQTRLFKKGFVSWPKGIPAPHAELIVKGSILKLPEKEKFAIIHYSHSNILHFLEIINRYTFKAEYFENKDVIHASDIVNYYMGEFKFRYFDHKGYLDGMHGFVLSKLMEYYRFIEFIRFWERKGYPELVSSSQLIPLLPSEDVQNELRIIKSSKFFKLWRFYNKIKSLIIKNEK